MAEGGPEVAYFHPVDYVVFAGLLLSALMVGAWFAFADRKKKSTDDYLMAGKNMKVIPVSVSMFVSWISAVAMLGDPVEVYRRGSNYALLGVGYVLALPAVAFFFAPFYHKLDIISIYTFLEMKYNKPLRLFASFINIVVLVAWSSVVLYGPSLAVSQVSGFPVWVCMVSTGLVAAVYTAMGGMKAILWVDTLQMVIMLLGLIAVVISGTVRAGGLGEIFAIAKEGGKLELGSLVPNPAEASSIWSHLIGGFFMILIPYVAAQLIVQRYSTVRTPSQAKYAVLLNTPVILCTVLLLWMCGLVMYSVFAGCDPLDAGRITHRDQMMPLLMMTLLGKYPGVPGLFIAALFSGSLSSLSSCYNASAAQTLADFIQPIYLSLKKKPLSEFCSMHLARGLAFFYGMLVMCLSFVVLRMGTTMFNLSLQVCGTFASPIGGVFIAGVIFPKLRNRSVMFGLFVSSAIMLWIGISAMAATKPPPPPRVLVIHACTGLNITSNVTTVAPLVNTTPYHEDINRNETSPPKSFQAGDFHPLYYNVIGVIVSLTMALLFQGVEGLIRKVLKCKYPGRYKSKDITIDAGSGIPLQEKRNENLQSR